MLELKLLGSPQIRYQERILEVPLRKNWALIAYLALEGKQDREKLAGLLWPESFEKRARGALRKSLLQLREALPKGAKGFLEARRNTLDLGKSSFQADVYTFEAIAKNNGHAGFQDLIKAAELYRGPFLEGFSLDSLEFDEWLSQRRVDLSRSYKHILRRLSGLYLEQGQYSEALETANRWLKEDPLDEAAYRQAMQVCYQMGDRSRGLATFVLCSETLKRELDIEPEAETLELAQSLRRSIFSAQTAVEQPSLQNPTAWVNHNLPAEAIPFVGRTQELGRISQMLTDPNCRLITLIGLGGMGKTHLALHVASTHLPMFPDGVYFVSLAHIDQTLYLATAIANAIGFNPTGSVRIEDQLIHFLKEKQILLVLDGYEHLGDLSLVSSLLQSTGLKVMVTSRRPLNLLEEWPLKIEGLNYPLGNFGNTDEYSATEFFIQEAQRHQPELKISLEDHDAIATICRLVGGMPLAILLAAAWIRVLSIEQIAQELSSNLGFLKSPIRNLPSRHSSLEIVFESTWNQLGEEQNALAKLAVFRGGFSLVAAEAVAQITLPQLSSLQDVSLVQKVAPNRFVIHEVLRHFVQAKLQNHPEYELVQQTYLSYFAGFLKQKATDLKSSRQQLALQELENEVDNLRTFWRKAITNADYVTITESIDGLWLFLETKSLFQEGLGLFNQAIEALQKAELGNSIAIASLYNRIVPCLSAVGKNPEAEEAGKRGLAIALALGDKAEEAVSRNYLGRVCFVAGRYTEALYHHQLALEAYRAIGDRWGMACTQSLIGADLMLMGNFSRAKEFYDQSLALCRSLGDPMKIAANLNDIAVLQAWKGNYTHADLLYQEAIAIRQSIGDRFGSADSMTNLGMVKMNLGMWDAALMLHQESLRLRREIGHSWGVSDTLGNLGKLELDRGKLAEARSFLEESLGICKENQDLFGIANGQINLGDIEFQTGHFDTAMARYEKALDTYKEQTMGWGEAVALVRLGWAKAMLGQSHLALEYLRKALEVCAKVKVDPTLMEIFVGIARILSYRGQIARAAEVLSIVLEHPASSFALKETAQRLIVQFGANNDPKPSQAKRFRKDVYDLAQLLLLELDAV